MGVSPVNGHGLFQFILMIKIDKNKIDLIYSTGGAWSAHCSFYWLKRKTKISWIAEIHDPLVQRK